MTRTAKRVALLLCFSVLCTPGARAQQAPPLVGGAGVVASANVEVAMRDGAIISLDIYRPAEPGRRPTLYAAAPYPHTTDSQPPDTPETGPVTWLVNQGYNYVLASVRGTGGSTGSFELLSREEQQDHYELIEWIATQDWSDGQVAGIGAGYYGTSQWQMAVQNPPHLACIAPFNGVSDPYRDWARPGGLESTDFSLWYERRVRDAHAFPATGQPRYIDFDLRLAQLQHPLLDDFWSTRSASSWFSQIRVPVFVLGDRSAGRLTDSRIFATHQALPDTTRILLPVTTDQLQNQDLLQNELLPFYAWCFGGKPASGFPEKPVIRIGTNNQGELYNLANWPPAGIRNLALYLAGPSASQEAPVAGSLQPLASQNDGESTTYGAGAEQEMLIFRSAPLSRALDLVGPLYLELYAGTSGADTAFSVELLEEEQVLQLHASPALPGFLAPGPAPTVPTATRENLVGSGVLKASAAITAAAGTAPLEPVFDRSARLAANQVYRVDVALPVVAYRFGVGSRLVLRIRQTADASLRNGARRDILYHSDRHASRLHLPVFSADSGSLADLFAPQPGDGTTSGPRLNEAAAALFDDSNPVILLPAP